jgi:hypothetical protein
MCDAPRYFQRGRESFALFIPQDAYSFIDQWAKARQIMARKKAPEFSRDEWAYLIHFLDLSNLVQPFVETFGEQVTGTPPATQTIIKPRGKIALWLPSNVSLLGPLMLVLLSLTGNQLRLKGGSKTENLTGIFLDYVLKHLPDSNLKSYLQKKVSIEYFDRQDLRNREMSAWADVRILFGSDETARAIEGLPHPVSSEPVYFVDKQSEVWVEPAAETNDTIRDLIHVLAIYGQAGCTSPKRVVLLGSTQAKAEAFRDRLISEWPKTITRLPALHIASENIMARQWALALGWKAENAANNAAVFAAGGMELPAFSAHMSLRIVHGKFRDAARTMPANIQTLGYAFEKPLDPGWLTRISGLAIKRLVPLANMHHFGHIWDGLDFWSRLFERVTVE